MTPTIERVRTHRARRKSGAGVLPFVPIADEIGVTEMLIAARLLAEHERDDRAAVARAVGKFINATVNEFWSGQ